MPVLFVNSLPLAFIDAGMVAVSIPIVALFIPIIYLLTSHQRKMAEIVHQGHLNQNQAGELEGIRQELQSMRTQMNQHTIALDDIRSKQALPATTQATFQERLNTP